jgi:SAM-dependent methyltransferase
MSTLDQLRSRLSLLLSRQARRHSRVGNPRLWRMKREFQFEFLKRMGLERGQRLLDLGCGTLRGGLPVIEFLEPGHYTGIDVRADVLDEARAELAEAGLAHRAPRLVLAEDLGALELPERFDWAWAFSVLIHMDDAVLERAFAFVARSLEPRGVFLANVRTESAGAGEVGRWQGFPVVARSVETYRAVARRHGFSVRDMGSLSGLGHVSGEPFQDGQHMLLLRRSEDA